MPDQVEMVLFVERYIICLMLFALGIHAPGIVTSSQYMNLGSNSNNSQVSIITLNEQFSVYCRLISLFLKISV